MIEIIQYPTKTDWRAIRMSCDFCGSVFEGTMNEFEAVYYQGKKIGYKGTCPFCARGLYYTVDDCEFWVCGPQENEKRKLVERSTNDGGTNNERT